MRIRWIDVCKGIGIILIYYGHAIERFADTGLKNSYYQWYYLYSFHMPMFFILSGYAHSQNVNNRIVFLKNKINRIVIPILFYNIVFMFLWIGIDLYTGVNVNIYILFKTLLYGIVKGGTLLPCAFTWFLYCIMIVYILHAIFNRILKSKKIIIALIVFIGAFGYWITSPGIGLFKINKFIRIWYFDEAFVAYTFFLIGIFIRSLERDFTGYFNHRNYLIVVIISIVLFYLTASLNDGPFRCSKQAVIMSMRSHGDLIFYIPAIAGSIALMSLSRLIVRNSILESIGKNSIPYFAINSAFFMWINIFFVKKIQDSIGLPESHFSTFLIVGFITVGSIAIVAPIVIFFSGYIPLLIGASDIKKK